jgi:hypothetical protein
MELNHLTHYKIKTVSLSMSWLPTRLKTHKELHLHVTNQTVQEMATLCRMGSEMAQLFIHKVLQFQIITYLVDINLSAPNNKSSLLDSRSDQKVEVSSS